jgi:hypothetical protein
VADGGKDSDAAMRWTYQIIGYRVVHWGAGLCAVQQEGHGYSTPYLHILAAAPADGGSDGETVGGPDGASVETSRTRHSSSNLISSSSSRSTADVLAYLDTKYLLSTRSTRGTGGQREQVRALVSHCALAAGHKAVLKRSICFSVLMDTLVCAIRFVAVEQFSKLVDLDVDLHGYGTAPQVVTRSDMVLTPYMSISA